MPCDTARLVSRSEPILAWCPSRKSVTANAASIGLRAGVLVRKPASRSAIPAG